MDIRKYLQGLGYNVLSDEWYKHIDRWERWYKGKCKDFHEYRVYNGVEYTTQERKTLGMAKKVSEDWADLLLNEKVNITLTDKEAQTYLDEILSASSFWTRGNRLVELAFALGTGAFVERVEGDIVKIDYVDAKGIYPLSWENGRIKECAFVSDYVVAKDKYVYICAHTLQNSKYVIVNKMFKDDGSPVGLPDGIADTFDTGSDIPMFQIIMPNIVNNIDRHNPMGISVFANSIDTLKGIDLVYDSYDNEFALGKKRIFVNSDVVKVDLKDGKMQPLFDTNDTVFYGVPMDKENSIKEVDMELRADEHETALQSQLNLLSAKVGFGQGYYKFDRETGVKTATEVVSENSQLFRKIKKHELLLEDALIYVARVVLSASKKYAGIVNDSSGISINFDDSIIEDTNATANRAMLELQSDVIDKVEYFVRVYKLSEEAAIKKVTAMETRKPKQPEPSYFEEGDGGNTT